MDEHDLPFKVGQLVEARSFLQGYRGAWFRCKIIDVHQKDTGMQYALRYYDFPDEKVKWTKLHQYPKPRLKNTERQLMVRPCFPSVYRESKLPEIKAISEVVVIVNDVWNVGDLVDWWTDDCYWSGTLTEALGNGKFQIDLLPPPVGEGSSYEADSKDFRPSLSWSLEHGWTVPIPSLEIVFCNMSVVLLFYINGEIGYRPASVGRSANLAVHAVDEGRKDPEATVKASFELNASFSSHITKNSLPPPHRSEGMAKSPLNPPISNKACPPGRKIGLDITNGGVAKTSCSDSVSSSHVRAGASAELGGNTGGDDNNAPLKKMRTDGGICLNSMCSDTIEASILDLERLANRVKLAKSTLESGTALSNTAGPSWKFLEYRSPSRPK
ncbi:unnamed protein product [Dovyalis caffra]|uniref:Agenet domain-containing protein n=1 Tax=Dovyalis caffra TaxID=77055 RepID=A0AAV1R450_9ROSI|nr:unnamed protein product [Dovyalis caffra]